MLRCVLRIADLTFSPCVGSEADFVSAERLPLLCLPSPPPPSFSSCPSSSPSLLDSSESSAASAVDPLSAFSGLPRGGPAQRETTHIWRERRDSGSQTQDLSGKLPRELAASDRPAVTVEREREGSHTFEREQDEVVRLESALQVTREQLVVALEPQLERLVDVRLRMLGSQSGATDKKSSAANTPRTSGRFTLSDCLVYMVIAAATCKARQA